MKCIEYGQARTIVLFELRVWVALQLISAAERLPPR